MIGMANALDVGESASKRIYSIKHCFWKKKLSSTCLQYMYFLFEEKTGFIGLFRGLFLQEIKNLHFESHKDFLFKPNGLWYMVFKNVLSWPAVAWTTWRGAGPKTSTISARTSCSSTGRVWDMFFGVKLLDCQSIVRFKLPIKT